MNVAVSLLLGAVVGRVGWVALRPAFDAPLFQRENYRGRSVPVAAGLVLAVAVIVVEAARALVDESGRASGLVLAAAAGFALLGFVDDVAGSGEDRGFKGHMRAMAHGRLTTGGLKLVAGGALALALVGSIADALLVALAANLGNLFDRAPGRVLKVSVLAFAALLAAVGAATVLGPVAVVIGAGLALLVDDLHERLMLGDTGSNVLGAVLGLGCVLALDRSGRYAVLAAVAALNLAGEVVSFSRVIDAVPPLRRADRAGRLPQ